MSVPVADSRTDVDEPDSSAERAIVFFDGVCGLCNSTVDFVFRHDRDGRFACAPLQGETAQELLSSEVRENLTTLVVQLPDGRQFIRSTAVARILLRLGGVWKLLGGLLWLIPRPIRDLGYRCVSRLRYRLFGKRDVCRMPTEEDLGRLLP